MLAQILAYVVIAFLSYSAFATVYSVGKPRGVVTPGLAVGALVCLSIHVAVMFYITSKL